jgi:imidazole glycerol-phosphate synthase subunit HisH
MISIVDYGMGNLGSVQKAIEKLGFNAKVTSEAKDVDDAAGVVLPGVGAFKDCMINLDKHKLIEPIRKAVASGKPFLGICLGLQVLMEESEEFGRHEGLGIFKGKVVKFSGEMPDLEDPSGKTSLKVPHMGWNQIKKNQTPKALEDIEDGTHYYFVHSYYVAPEDKSIIATTTDYGIDYTSSVAKDNLFACQFHPEKSQKMGLKLLQNFGEMVKNQ